MIAVACVLGTLAIVALGVAIFFPEDVDADLKEQAQQDLLNDMKNGDQL